VKTTPHLAFALACVLCAAATVDAETGNDAWLRYEAAPLDYLEIHPE
jgi:hypothetical protein